MEEIINNTIQWILLVLTDFDKLFRFHIFVGLQKTNSLLDSDSRLQHHNLKFRSEIRFQTSDLLKTDATLTSIFRIQKLVGHLRYVTLLYILNVISMTGIHTYVMFRNVHSCTNMLFIYNLELYDLELLCKYVFSILKICYKLYILFICIYAYRLNQRLSRCSQAFNILLLFSLT